MSKEERQSCLVGRLLSSSDSRDTALRFLKRRPPRTPSSEGRRDRELIVAGGLNINPVWIRRRHEHSCSMAAVPACRGGQSPPPIGTDDCHHGLVVAVLISNRSPMRWSKSVGRFHLPSAVCPPSVFGETPSGRVGQELEALDGPGAQGFMTHNPHRGDRNWSVGSAFRPTFVRLPCAFRAAPGVLRASNPPEPASAIRVSERRLSAVADQVKTE